MPVHASAVFVAGCAVLLASSSRHAARVGADSPVWDSSTLTLVREDAAYGRIRRIGSRKLVAVYELAGAVHVSFSGDNGKTWRNGPRAASIAYGHAANPEALVTRQGRILLFFNERPTDGLHPFAISMADSEDGGATWSRHRTVFEADTRFENGCWEPAAVEMPDGEIRLVFANESPYRASSEQEITMICSRDSGATWGETRVVSFRPGARDGMPVPVLLGSRHELHIAIEDSGLSGLMKPAVVRIGAHLPVGPDSADRWPALARQPAPEVNVAAPYIVRMPVGVTFLSCQVTEGGRKPRMVVYVGDSDARCFGHASEPFATSADVAGMWNSLLAKDRWTVTAVSSTAMNGRDGLWSIDGRLGRTGSNVSTASR